MIWRGKCWNILNFKIKLKLNATGGSMPSQVERDFVRRALGASLRLDQRSLDDLRPLKIEFDPQLTGRVIVSLGGTK